MRKNKLVDIESTIEKAKALRQKEAYQILDKKANYVIGIGAKNITSKTPSFFIEIILILCPKSGKLDLKILEKWLLCLQKLYALNYSLTCQEDNTIICNITIGRDKLEEEYKNVKSFLNQFFEE
ncbi:MAG: hypothetical protein N3F64_03115 [Nitrososphaeria archaeon]|nr:hypothetical protein [Nitrososphaeria archaeon]